MKIALFANVHADLPAMEALLRDLDSRKPDAIYCLGDLIGQNHWPNQVINHIRGRGIPAVAGQADDKIRTLVTLRHHLTERDNNYAYHLVSPQNREYLITLPRGIRLEYVLNNDETIVVVLAHGSDEIELMKSVHEDDADILCFGYSHAPFQRVIVKNGKRNKYIIQVGAVGRSENGDENGQAGYVLLTMTENSSLTDMDSIKVEFVRIAYNQEPRPEG